MKPFSLWVLLFLATALAYCQSPTVAETDTQQEAEVLEVLDLSYLPAERITADSLQRLNLVVPTHVENAPLLVWIGGGAWSYVDRAREMELAHHFAKKGVAVASIGHRLSAATWRDESMSEGIQHPEHVKDLAAAVKWLHTHAETYGYDGDNLFVGGFSSGAHLAALVYLDEKYLAAEGISRDIIKGLIPISGTYDIADYHRAFAEGSRPELAELHVESVFGPTPADWEDASPISYLDALEAPMLIMTDEGIHGYTRIFEDQLLETDFREFEFINVHRLTHVELWQHIGQREQSIYRDLMIEFIQSHS